MSLGFVYEITAKCNLGCSFCYNVWKPGEFGAELTEDKSIELLDKVLTEAQPEWLAYAGGEPTCCEHLPEVMRHVSQKFPGIRQGLATNALLLSEDYLKTLIDAGLGYVEISLFADSPESYSRQTKATGRVFDHATQAITTAKLYALPVSAAIMLSAQNAESFATLLDIALTTGADRVAVNRFVPTGSGEKNKVIFAIDSQLLREQLTIADAKAQQFGKAVTLTIPVRPCETAGLELKNLELSQCVCGIHKWTIDPAGNLRTCEQNSQILGNLLKSSFAELSGKPSVKEFRNWRPADNCQSCQWLNTCNGGCRFCDIQKE